MTNPGEKARANARAQVRKVAAKRAGQFGEKLLEPYLKIAEKLAQVELHTAELKQAEALFKAQAAQAAMETTKRTGEKLVQQAASVVRPTTALRPTVVDQEDGCWSASYGDVQGVGPTPETACQDFDRKWLGKDEL